MNRKRVFMSEYVKHLCFWETEDVCCGEAYQKFLDFCFENYDYFMLVYVNDMGKGFTAEQKNFLQKLKPFMVKSRSKPTQWPGTICRAKSTKFKIVFYKTCEQAKQILKAFNSISDWLYPDPEDLAFFKGNQCRFYSVTHEIVAGFCYATEREQSFVETAGIRVYEERYDSQITDYEILPETKDK